MKWNVFNKKTGALLGVVVKYYKNTGTTSRPTWRAWYCLEGREDVNADVRTAIAVFLAGGPGYRMELV